MMRKELAGWIAAGVTALAFLGTTIGSYVQERSATAKLEERMTTMAARSDVAKLEERLNTILRMADEFETRMQRQNRQISEVYGRLDAMEHRQQAFSEVLLRVVAPNQAAPTQIQSNHPQTPWRGQPEPGP